MKTFCFALALCACGTNETFPDVGDPSYQTATICTPNELAEPLSEAVELWHEAAPRVKMQTVIGGTECDVTASWEHLVPPSNSGAVPGFVFFDPSLRGTDLLVVATHELGHLLLGHAHNPDPESVMFWASTKTTITKADLARLP